MVVLPALSKPTIIILCSSFENKFHSFENKNPIKNTKSCVHSKWIILKSTIWWEYIYIYICIMYWFEFEFDSSYFENFNLKSQKKQLNNLSWWKNRLGSKAKHIYLWRNEKSKGLKWPSQTFYSLHADSNKLSNFNINAAKQKISHKTTPMWQHIINAN